jgi:hypothetical protein
VLHLALHITESHPDQPVEEAEREAREQEEARQARVAAEIARQEAEAAQRKAEARARRQALEGLPSTPAPPEPVEGFVPRSPLRAPSVPDGPPDAPTAAAAPATVPDVRPPEARSSGGAEATRTAPTSRSARPTDETWERLRRALADRTVLTGVVRTIKPFGVFVDVGGIDGLVRSRELAPAEGGREAPGLQPGATAKVVVIGLTEDPRRVELSMRRAAGPTPPPLPQPATGPAPRPAARPTARPAEGPMALAFRLAMEKKKQAE